MRARALFLLLLVACGGTSVNVTALPPDARIAEVAPRFGSTIEAIEHGDLAGLSARTDVGPSERDLVAALADVERGRFEEAERMLARLAAASTDEVRSRASVAHLCVLMHLGRWADIVRVHRASDEFVSLRPLADGWASAPPERVTFTAPSMTLPASLEDVDVPFVEVHVGDRPYRFLLDTGAMVTLISSDVAKAAGIVPAGSGTAVGTATTHRVDVKPAVIPRLAVGNAVFANHPCIVADPDDLRFKRLFVTFLRLDGVIGWNAIRRLDLEIDFRVPQVTIRRPSPRAVERNLFWLGAPLVRARLADGPPILAGLDTGASNSHLLPSFFAVRRETDVESRKGTTRVWGAGGSERVATRTVKDLSVVVNRHVLEFRNIEAHGRCFASVFTPVIQLGNDIALPGALRIDFANGALELRQ